MALINCPECGKEISDKAASCPNCGNPMSQQAVITTANKPALPIEDKNSLRCPKCNSTQLTSNKKGFSGGKAVAGVILTGGIGLAAGAIGKNKIIITCLKCGNQFKPGEGTETSHNDQQSNHSLPDGVSIVKLKTELITYDYKCPLCEKVYVGDMHHCPKCGRPFLEKDKIEKSKEKNAGCAGVVLLFIMLTGSLIAIL